MLGSNAFILAFIQGFHIQYSQEIIEYYMSIILQTPPQAEIPPAQNIIENVRRIMLLEFQALQFKLENQPTLYKTFLTMANQAHMILLWRFQQVLSKNSIKVYIRPNLSQSIGHNFKAETQRNFVDLLKVINKCNKERSKSISFIISDFSYIEFCTSFLTNQVSDCVMLRKLIKSTIIQLPEAIKKLLSELRPFLEERNIYGTNEFVPDSQRMFIDRGLKLLNLIRFNQLKNQDQSKKEKENSRNQLDQRQIEQKLEMDRMETHRKLKDCLKLLGFSQAYLKNQSSSALPIYHEWMNRFKQEPQKKVNKLKNVHGIRIIKQDNINIERNLQGSHCKIVLSKFQVLMMISVNSETNSALQAMKKSDGTPLISQKIIKIQKQLELVKKLLKNPEKKQSQNSFQNELQFILYIKERGFRYISTYYWQFQKKRTQMQTILANYYPHNMRQMLHTQGKLMSVREKLALLQQIISGVNWLANNYVCHRDIKPQNIMIDEHKTPKIIDFGSCCPAYGVGNDHFRVTQTRLLGTPYYHHAYNEEVSKDYKRNQYQQHLLFDAYSLGKVMRDIFDEGLPNLLPNLQGILNYMIERCLQPNPGRRVTYQQLLFVLDNFIHYLDWWMCDSTKQCQPKVTSFPFRT